MYFSPTSPGKIINIIAVLDIPLLYITNKPNHTKLNYSYCHGRPSPSTDLHFLLLIPDELFKKLRSLRKEKFHISVQPVTGHWYALSSTFTVTRSTQNFQISKTRSAPTDRSSYTQVSRTWSSRIRFYRTRF